MKRPKLQIICYDPDSKPVCKILATKVDALQNHTVIFCATQLTEYECGSMEKYLGDQFIFEKIDHYDMSHGLLTIYYKNDYFMEVRKIA